MVKTKEHGIKKGDVFMYTPADAPEINSGMRIVCRVETLPSGDLMLVDENDRGWVGELGAFLFIR